MTHKEMREVVRCFVRAALKNGEEDRASRTRITENEREAISLGLSDAFDNTLDQLLQEAFKDTVGKYAGVLEVLKRHRAV